VSPIGPGKYDDLCTHVRETAKAEGVIVIVINGERGQGFSVQAPPHLTYAIPALLRRMADEIEQSLRKL
jgi:hypothetical protein